MTKIPWTYLWNWLHENLECELMLYIYESNFYQTFKMIKKSGKWQMSEEENIADDTHYDFFFLGGGGENIQYTSPYTFNCLAFSILILIFLTYYWVIF